MRIGLRKALKITKSVALLNKVKNIMYSILETLDEAEVAYMGTKTSPTPFILRFEIWFVVKMFSNGNCQLNNISLNYNCSIS